MYHVKATDQDWKFLTLLRPTDLCLKSSTGLPLSFVAMVSENGVSSSFSSVSDVSKEVADKMVLRLIYSPRWMAFRILSSSGGSLAELVTDAANKLGPVPLIIAGSCGIDGMLGNGW